MTMIETKTEEILNRRLMKYDSLVIGQIYETKCGRRGELYDVCDRTKSVYLKFSDRKVLDIFIDVENFDVSQLVITDWR